MELGVLNRGRPESPKGYKALLSGLPVASGHQLVLLSHTWKRLHPYWCVRPGSTRELWSSFYTRHNDSSTINKSHVGVSVLPYPCARRRHMFTEKYAATTCFQCLDFLLSQLQATWNWHFQQQVVPPPTRIPASLKTSKTDGFKKLFGKIVWRREWYVSSSVTWYTLTFSSWLGFFFFLPIHPLLFSPSHELDWFTEATGARCFW